MRPLAASYVDRILLMAVLLGAAALTATSPIEASPPAYLGGVAGLVAIHERLRKEFRPSVSLLSVLAIFGGTTLFWSMTRVSSFADVAAFALVAALLYLADRLLVGRTFVWGAAALAPLGIQYLIGEIGGGSPTEISIELFSSTHGLLSLSPVAYFALLGVLLSLKQQPLHGAVTLLVFTVWLISNSLTGVSAPSDGPAAHRLTPALALLAPGLAHLIEQARRHPLAAVAPLLAVGLAWNYWLMVQYTVGAVPKDAPVSFGEVVRQQAAVHTAPPYVYPFALPANVWFAWRQNVPVERYELLAAEPAREAIDLPLDRRSDRFVLEGWEARAAEDREPVRWIGERRASLVVPLTPTEGRSTAVVMTLRARLEDPPVAADLALEINGFEVGRFVVPADKATEVRLAVPADAVGRTFRAGYNRLTFVSYGVHRPDAQGQPAPPEQFAGRSGNRAWPVAVYRIHIAPQ